MAVDKMFNNDDLDELLEIVDALCTVLMRDGRHQMRALPNVAERAAKLRRKRLQLREGE